MVTILDWVLCAVCVCVTMIEVFRGRPLTGCGIELAPLVVHHKALASRVQLRCAQSSRPPKHREILPRAARDSCTCLSGCQRWLIPEIGGQV